MTILNPKTNDLSVMLNTVRYLAAFAVCTGHAISIFGFDNIPLYRSVAYIQSLGVIIFFTLSGFLIAHVLSTQSANPSYTLTHYLIDRFSRIYTAYFPALFFIAFIDYINRFFGGFIPFSSIKIFIGNIFMFQNYLGPLHQLVSVPSFGTAGQLWTLSIEFFIYVFVGSFYFFLTGNKTKTVLISCVLSFFVVFPYFSAETHGLPGEGLLVLWLLGCAVYFIVSKLDLNNHSVKTLALLSFFFFLFWVSTSIRGDEYRLESYLLAILFFIFFVMLSAKTRVVSRSNTFTQLTKTLASFSFSLYLTHLSIISFIKQLWIGNPLVGMFIAIVICNAFAFAFASITEFKHKAFSNYLKCRFLKK